MKFLLVNPPLTQINTPYPAPAYLKGSMQALCAQEGLQEVQFRCLDAALELALEALSSHFARSLPDVLWERDRFFQKHREEYTRLLTPVIQFLQGKDPSLAYKIAYREMLPPGPHLRRAFVPEELEAAFGGLGLQDRAKYLCSLFVDDWIQFLQTAVDPDFGLSRYGEKLAASQLRFDALADRLEKATHAPSPIEAALIQKVKEWDLHYQPDVLGLSLPFPGTVYAGLLMSKVWKSVRPSLKVVAGGGYVNTELREWMGGPQSRMAIDPRVMDCVDFWTYDDGERPLLQLLKRLTGRDPQAPLVRTVFRGSEGEVVCSPYAPQLHDIPFSRQAAPDYSDFRLGDYVHLFESLNPMHRIWSDGFWNKMTLAHGCYWKKCSFCDVSLDYIGRYEVSPAARLVDQMEAIAQQTGRSGFHFVDEAAPPATLKSLSQEILKRGKTFHFWGNVRFEKAFDRELCELLSQAGCVAISGGLEVASPRLLKLMNKGVTTGQVAQVTRQMTQSGIMVHAYLMYGFPSQTALETLESLERVRQLFAEGCIQSGFWHRFSATAHSPVGRNPEKFGIKILTKGPTRFAWNDLDFEDSVKTDHDLLGLGLKRALFNYMRGVGLDQEVRKWFPEFESKYGKFKKVPQIDIFKE